jgi:hypothetical protein
MGMFNNPPPNLPLLPKEYDSAAFNRFNQVLNLFFQRLNAVQNINVATLNFDLNTLPTEADLATLRDGDVYRDTTASNVLKVKA